jgi:FlaA1/EpsC-like NDP-sugar epimerase
MSKVTKKMNFVEYIMMAIVVICLIIAIVSRITGYYGMISFISLCAIFMVIAIVSPVNNYFKKGIINNKRTIMLIFLRLVLVVMLIISWYEILFTKNYNLKYTYWAAVISLGSIMVLYFIQKLINDYENKKFNNKGYNKLNIIGTTLLVFLIPSFYFFNFIQSFSRPKHHIVINALKVPEKISVYKLSKDERDKKSAGFMPISEITSPEDIKKITKELERRSVVNITSIDLINFERMKSDSYPCYIMRFDYDNTNGLATKLENGYIEQMRVTSSRNIVMEEFTRKDESALFEKYYYDIYPVGLSKETVDMIFSYFK